LDHVIGEITPNIYGHFIEHLGGCIYPGIWVGEESKVPNEDGLRKDLLTALKRINPPVIRWPGGCFADHYHWEDGVGPQDQRPRRVNLSWGGEESNEFGTDEFLSFCSKVGAEPYICVNVGSGSPSEAYYWIEYCNGKGDTYHAKLREKYGHPESYGVKYWGVGNENWGCGGFFDPVYYAWEYRRFAGFMNRVSREIKLIACGWQEEWNLKLMEELRNYLNFIDYLSIHYYFGQGRYGGDLEFTDDDYYRLLIDIQYLEYEIKRAIDIIDSFAGERKDIRIAVDEWGTWYPQANFESGLYQQSTLRDAILAASVLNLFNNYSRKVVMANIAQMVNVLQSLFLTKDDKVVLTPTYHVFDMYKSHMKNDALKIKVEAPIVLELERPRRGPQRSPPIKLEPLYAINASASLQKGERLILTVTNTLLDSEMEVKVQIKGEKEVNNGRATLLTAINVREHNDFSFPERVTLTEKGIDAKGQSFTYVAPPHSVNTLTIKLK